jgi:hypothetical protein
MPDYASRLNAAEDKTIGQLESDYIRSVQVTVRETDWSKLERDLQAYTNGDAVVDGIAWKDYDPRARLSKLFEVGLSLHGEEIGQLVGGAKFDFVDPNALKWIDEYGAKDVKYISDSSRAAIRNVILTGYEDGNTPRDMAREIKTHIGLDEARSKTLQKYSENLFAKGLPDSEVWRLMETKGKALLNARANTIAINEVSEAGAQATYQSTKSAVERGVLSPFEWEGYRIITADERTCPFCNGAAGETRRIPDGVYASGSTNAKLHTKCRCVEGLREINMKKGKEMKESVAGYADVVIEGRIKETDTSLFVPTVPLVEGVFNGRGFPVLRLYEEFSKDVRWLNGLTVLKNHEELSPDARRIGQFANPVAEDTRKRAKVTTEFFKIDCTQREIDQLKSNRPPHGSMQFTCNLEMTAGDYQGNHYEAIERGPYIWREYSLVSQGVVTPEDGAGFNIECSGCKSPAHGAVQGDTQKMSDIVSGHEPEVKESIDALKVEFESIKTEFATIKEENVKLKATIEADKKARVLESFQAKLKPGHLAEAEKLFAEYAKDPASWVLENADKFVQVKESKLKGNAITEGAAPVFDLQKKQDELFGRAVV